MLRKLLRAAAFVIPSSVLIMAFGGWGAILGRPVGVVYLVLWALWWAANALGRPRGAPSDVEGRHKVVYVLGIAVFVLLIVGPPWEYTHFEGPLLRDSPLAWVGLLIFAAGIALQIMAMAALQGFYTSRLGIQAGHRLITTGPYRWIRHPGYLSNILSLLGISLALSSLIGLGLTGLSALLILSRIKTEEQMLRLNFGSTYERYAERTWRLVPFLY